ncbi:MAG: SpoIIE family protein phosphatase [Chitinivibrionales bacterium]|nr:SpoIIE family protein phosphatase [Chitinivibrionales bacterium]
MPGNSLKPISSLSQATTSKMEKLPEKEDKDFLIARKVQEAMIPHSLPAIEGIDIASLYHPCSTVGGDLFDVIHISEDMLAFLIFDVSGHGVSSALIASMAKLAFLNHIRNVASPRSLIERVNKEIVQHALADYFITAFAAFLDLHNNKLSYCNAGHPPPLVFKKEDRQLVSLGTSGLFIGIFEDGLYEEKILYLNPGDWLVLFSNGIYSLFNSENELQGRKRLELEILRKLDDCSPAGLVECFDSKLNDLQQTRALDDDLTAIVIEVLTASRKNQIKDKLGFDPKAPVYLMFINYFEEMDRATAVILKEMDEFGYPDDSIRKMKIALTELLANAIYHGNKKDHTKKVTIGHITTKHHVTVAIMDEGEGFDIDAVPDPTLPENLEKDCGRGLFIVRNYVDFVDYNEKGNRVIIRKHRITDS